MPSYSRSRRAFGPRSRTHSDGRARLADSGSLDDPRWQSVITLDAAYTYYPTYAQVLKEYNRSHFLPVVMAEARYEFEGNPPDYGDPPMIRREAYWSMLSGAAGQFYGNHYTWPFAPDWQKS